MDNEHVVNLSVILPTYKRDKIVCNVIRQLLKQDPKPLEIIVIDQTEEHDSDTRAFLEGLIKENKIRYIYQEIPHPNIARNCGIRESKGEIVLILNDDIIIGQNLIGAHYANFKDPTIAAVSGAVLENTEALTDKFTPQYYRKYTGWMHFPLNFSERSEVINLNSCNLSIRRDIILEAGGFDENFIKPYLDDGELSLRIHNICLKKKLKTIHDPEAFLIHLLDQTGSNRPGGINEYVIADRYSWMLVLYFFILNFGIYGSWEILLRLRACVFRKKNILKPLYLWVAFLEFVIGLYKALALIRKGKKLGLREDMLLK